MKRERRQRPPDAMVRQLRAELGISRDAFARKLEGSTSSVWKWERGERIPSLASAIAIVEAWPDECDALGITVGDLAIAIPNRTPKTRRMNIGAR